jgi:hypothetical protein
MCLRSRRRIATTGNVFAVNGIADEDLVEQAMSFISVSKTATPTYRVLRWSQLEVLFAEWWHRILLGMSLRASASVTWPTWGCIVSMRSTRFRSRSGRSNRASDRSRDDDLLVRVTFATHKGHAELQGGRTGRGAARILAYGQAHHGPRALGLTAWLDLKNQQKPDAVPIRNLYQL